MEDKFRKELKEKLSQRTTSGVAEEKSMLFALRYYDLENTGHTNLKQFRQFLTKFGIHHFEAEASQRLFQLFDTEQRGAVEHRELIARMLGTQVLPIGTSSKRSTRGDDPESPKPIKKLDPAAVEKLLDMMSYKATRKGMTGLLEIAFECLNADRRGDSCLNFSSFSTALNRCNLELGQNEIESVFRYLESSRVPDHVEYFSMIEYLKNGGLNPNRRSILKDAFTKLDYKASQQVDLSVVVSLFNPRNHFDVKGGRKTQDEIQNEFKEAVHMFCELRGGNGVVNFNDFLDFWEYVSPSVVNDNHFEAFIKQSFRYNELPNKKSTKIGDIDKFEQRTASSAHSVSGSIKFPENSRVIGLMETLRNQLSKGGPKKHVQFYQALKHNDHDHDNKLAYKEFSKACHDLRVSLPDHELQTLFNAFDKKSNMFLDIPAFMCTFIPELNDRRQRTVDDLLGALSSPSDKSIVPLSQIKKFYYPRGHTDFTKKKRPDYEIKDEFFWLLSTFLQLSGGSQENIPRDLALQFFELYSNAFSSDDEFCDVLIGSFRMDRICNGTRPNSSHLEYSQHGDAVSVARSNISHPYSVAGDQPPARPASAQSGRQIGNQTPQPVANAKTPYRLDAPYSQPTFHKQEKPAEVASRNQNREAAMNGESHGARTPQPTKKNVPVHAYHREDDVASPADSRGGHHQQTPPKRGDYTPEANSYEKDYHSPLSTGASHGHHNGHHHHTSSSRSHPRAGSTFQAVKDRITQSLKNNQMTYFSLEKAFVIADSHKNRLATQEKIHSCLEQVGVQLSPHDLELAFEHVAQGQTSINYLDFISACRGQMSPQRESAVNDLFQKLGNTRTQEISTNALVSKLRVDRFRGGNPQKLKEYFVSNMELFGKLGGYDLQNNLMKQDEFLEFFDGLSAMETQDDNFFSLVQGCFA